MFFPRDKSLEVSYALIRVAALVRRPELKSRLEKLAFDLLEKIATEKPVEVLEVTAALQALLHMGQSLYEIDPENVKVIIGEINAINSAMRQSSGLGDLPDFSRIAGLPDDSAKHSNNSATIESEGQPDSVKNGNGFSATLRQSAILEKVRNSDNSQIQLKDILAAFPEVSERTMRYDLQKLCSQGLLERVGNGGPASFYSVRNKA